MPFVTSQYTHIIVSSNCAHLDRIYVGSATDSVLCQCLEACCIFLRNSLDLVRHVWRDESRWCFVQAIEQRLG